MERVNCKDCDYLDERCFCKLNPPLGNGKVHIFYPSTEWCGQGKRRIEVEKSIDAFYEEAKREEDKQPILIDTSLAKRGRPKKGSN